VSLDDLGVERDHVGIGQRIAGVVSLDGFVAYRSAFENKPGRGHVIPLAGPSRRETRKVVTAARPILPPEASSSMPARRAA